MNARTNLTTGADAIRAGFALIYRGLSRIDNALDTIKPHADPMATDPLREALAALQFTTIDAERAQRDVSTLVNGLAEAVRANAGAECMNCHLHKIDRQALPYGERVVIHEQRECTADGPKDCPVVQRCGLGEPLIEIPEWLGRQAS